MASNAQEMFAVAPFLLATAMLPWLPSEAVPVCSSLIFCQGELLETIQNSSIFNDSKEFVDRPLLADPATILQKFKALPDHSNATLEQFVERWTAEAGSDLVQWTPPDWIERPSFVDNIKNDNMRQWALELNRIWKELGREVHQSVALSPTRHSLLELPRPFIAPGGRFREIYYWDTYWIIEGLILCEMMDTARGMIENLAHLMNQYGLLPNGGRVYYTRRSQPPLLTQMVDLYYNRTNNRTFLQDMLPSLQAEYQFWMGNRTVNVSGHALNRYDAPTTGPRPESYREDVATSHQVPPEDRASLFKNLASATESGWDFSTRWFSRDGAGQVGPLSSVRTSLVVPVDLNAILCQNEATLARLYTIIGKSVEANFFKHAAEQRRVAFQDVFWNETQGLWVDWDLETGRQLQGKFYASSLSPLAWSCGPTDSEQQEKVLAALNSLGVLDYLGGIPSSLQPDSLQPDSSQQWDYPNAWALLQWQVVRGWRDSPSSELREAAARVAHTWLTSTYHGWQSYGAMFEKYNCTESGQPGGGGEYEPQTGFGWTNGVVLLFLSLYPDTAIPGSSTRHSEQNLGWVAAVVLFILAIAIFIPCVVWCRWLYVTGRDRYWGRVRNEHLMAAQGGRSHSRPHSPTMYTNRYAEDSISPDTMDGTLLECDV